MIARLYNVLYYVSVGNQRDEGFFIKMYRYIKKKHQKTGSEDKKKLIFWMYKNLGSYSQLGGKLFCGQ